MNASGRSWRCDCLLACAVLLLAPACIPAGSSNEGASAGIARGRLLLEQYDCGRCHVIPGVRRSHGLSGPTLAAYARRSYIAGELPNQPTLLAQWIQHPQGLVPDTSMPDLGVQAAHAQDMVLYLMSLR